MTFNENLKTWQNQKLHFHRLWIDRNWSKKTWANTTGFFRQNFPKYASDSDHHFTTKTCRLLSIISQTRAKIYTKSTYTRLDQMKFSARASSETSGYRQTHLTVSRRSCRPRTYLSKSVAWCRQLHKPRKGNLRTGDFSR